MRGSSATSAYRAIQWSRFASGRTPRRITTSRRGSSARAIRRTGYITGSTELRLLAGGNLTTSVVHEFAHAVSLNMNTRFANNPRWFWETVALYENGEFVNPRSIESVSRGNFPTLQQLNADVNADTQIYQLGFLLGDFIVTNWGRPAFLRLIQTNADLASVLGVSAAEFESAWQSYVRQRYLS
jgi:hypothetical protein